MAKYMIQASYSAEGIKGLMKDKASGRRENLVKTLRSVGGNLEAFYYAFGKYDAVVIADVPDNVTAAAVALAASASGLVRCHTTPLLTIEETDSALKKTVKYRAPGK